MVCHGQESRAGKAHEMCLCGNGENWRRQRTCVRVGNEGEQRKTIEKKNGVIVATSSKI